MLLALLLAVSACTDDPAAPTTAGSPQDAPVTLPPLTTLSPTTTSTTTTTAGPASGDVVDSFVAEINDLIEAAERVRGLGFIAKPTIVVLSPVEFSARVELLLDRREDENFRDDAMTLLFRLVGRLDDGDDLSAFRRDLNGLPETAWYDDSTGSLLVADSPVELGPLARSEVVHEVVHALADQHYRWASYRSESLPDADDRLAAFDALVEGDATYFQLLYIQQMSQADREEVALAFVDSSAAAEGVPGWVIEDLAFPFDQGFEFVADLVASGGIAAVDRAYLDPPSTSEQVLHPERYRRGESGLAANQDDALLEGYTEVGGVVSFGEWGLRLMLEEAMSPGLLTQIADGWGGDAYQIFVTGGGEVAFALLYLGDAESHTIEVTQAFIDFAEDVLGLGEGVRTDGGAVYSRGNRPWVFLDREDSGLLVVIASEASAGRSLVEQLSPPRSEVAPQP